MAPSVMIGLCLLLSYSCMVRGDSLTDKLDAAGHSLDSLTRRVVQLTRDLDSKIARGQKADETGEDFGTLLDRNIGNGCEGTNMFRCGASAQCLGQIVVCDGQKDCANGADEERCDSLVSEGDVFIGACGTNTCGNQMKQDVTYQDAWVLKRIERIPWFPQGETIRWVYFGSDDSTIGYDSGFAHGLSYHWKGLRRFQALYDYEGGTILDTCSLLESGNVLKCWGYQSSSFEIGEPCYTCHYRRK